MSLYEFAKNDSNLRLFDSFIFNPLKVFSLIHLIKSFCDSILKIFLHNAAGVLNHHRLHSDHKYYDILLL